MPIFVALSSNIDEPQERVLEAMGAIDAHPQIELLSQSSIYRTKPWGYVSQPDFFNAVCQIATDLAPLDLLLALQQLEKDLGRTPPPVRWGPRRIDLDLLLYEDLQIVEPDMKIPHPLIRERAFVLAPLLEIAPHLCDPVSGTPYEEDLRRVSRPGDIIGVSPSQ